MTKPLLIHCEKVAVYREQYRVFENFNLKIHEGEHTVILGPNGAGKSTFLRMLTRDLYPAWNPETKFELFGESRWNLFDLRKRLGILSLELQSDIPTYLTGKNLVFSGYQGVMDPRAFREFTDEEVAHVDAIMQELNIAHLGDRLFLQLSSGEARRFLLARALVNHPELLIFDEPTSNLDPHLMFQYLSILRRLLHQKCTLVLVTHHIHEIPPEIHRVVLLKEGKIVADGKKKEVLTRDNLSKLFDIELDLVEHNGFYSMFPKN